MVGGTGVGWVMGGVVGSITYPLREEKIQEDFSLVQQNIIQDIWKKLESRGKIPRSDFLQGKIDKTQLGNPREVFTFGSSENPFNGFFQIRPVHFQLFRSQYDGPEELTLRINVRWILLDSSRATIMEEEIQVDKGPYSFEEWSDADEWLLKSNLGNAYEDIARHIVSDLQLSPHALYKKPQLSPEAMLEKEKKDSLQW